MIHTFSFCKICEMYHVNWDKGQLNKDYETHLTPEQKLDSLSFDQYQVPVNGLKNTVMICYSVSMANKLKNNMRAFK